MLTVGRALSDARKLLRQAGVEAPDLSAECLLADVLGIGRARLFASLPRPLPGPDEVVFRDRLQRRAEDEPLAYITGWVDFCGLRLRVDSRVLIPRPETELIVETARQLLPSAPVIVDLGTGSGALAISLARRYPTATVHAVDSSREALKVVSENVRLHRLSDRIRIHQSDWGASLPPDLNKKASLVVCNPPYVADSEKTDPWVRRYEPHDALFSAGALGLVATRHALQAAIRLMAPHGICLFEVGYGKAEYVVNMMDELGLHGMETRRDCCGVDRVVLGRARSANRAESSGRLAHV